MRNTEFALRNKNRKTEEAKTGRGLYSTLRTPHPLFQEGFTLIEIIIVIVLAGIIIPVIVVPFVTGIRMSNQPEMVTTAMYFAHKRMEELMKYNYCNPALNVTGGFVAFTTGGEPNYTGQNNISYVNNTFTASGSDVGYKMIQVTITDPQGSTYNVYSVVTRF
jgi:prepilin-type N-terminal cleavage/methylation domain-containing protein